jgi:predicted HicB family RNase H-like nuclease
MALNTTTVSRKNPRPKVSMTIRVPKQVRDRAKADAKDRNMSLSTLIVGLLSLHWAQTDIPKAEQAALKLVSK